jgi:hypothetical protein
MRAGWANQLDRSGEFGSCVPPRGLLEVDFDAQCEAGGKRVYRASPDDFGLGGEDAAQFHRREAFSEGVNGTSRVVCRYAYVVVVVVTAAVHVPLNDAIKTIPCSATNVADRRGLRRWSWLPNGDRDVALFRPLTQSNARRMNASNIGTVNAISPWRGEKQSPRLMRLSRTGPV